jgi:hypothetical protein
MHCNNKTTHLLKQIAKKANEKSSDRQLPAAAI